MRQSVTACWDFTKNQPGICNRVFFLSFVYSWIINDEEMLQVEIRLSMQLMDLLKNECAYLAENTSNAELSNANSLSILQSRASSLINMVVELLQHDIERYELWQNGKGTGSGSAKWTNKSTGQVGLLIQTATNYSSILPMRIYERWGSVVQRDQVIKALEPHASGMLAYTPELVQTFLAFEIPFSEKVCWISFSSHSLRQ